MTTLRLSSVRASFPRATLLILVAGCALSACGKPATVEDCQHIMSRITELELKAANVSDPAAIAAQIAKTKESFDEAARGQCVGRRMSQATRECVDEAQTARELVEECFN